jgi:biopolymer transport protein ExbB
MLHALRLFTTGLLLACSLQLTAQELADTPVAAPAVAESIDPTAAAAGEETKTIEEVIGTTVPLVKRFQQGGLTMWFLLALSFVAVTFTFERLVRLRKGILLPKGLADKTKQAWAAKDFQTVAKACEAQPSVLAQAIRVMVDHRHLPGAETSIMVGDEVSRLMRKNLQQAYPLAVVATLAPLLGLLGTVTGMIDSFEVVAIAGSLGDASLLAGGISKALVTTAFGLIVSIPALGAYHFFRGRTNDFSLEVEEEVNDLLGRWFHAPSPATTATAD